MYKCVIENQGCTMHEPYCRPSDMRGIVRNSDAAFYKMAEMTYYSYDDKHMVATDQLHSYVLIQHHKSLYHKYISGILTNIRISFITKSALAPKELSCYLKLVDAYARTMELPRNPNDPRRLEYPSIDYRGVLTKKEYNKFIAHDYQCTDTSTEPNNKTRYTLRKYLTPGYDTVPCVIESSQEESKIEPVSG